MTNTHKDVFDLPAKEVFAKEAEEARLQSIEKKLIRTSDVFNSKAKTIKKDILQHIKENPDSTSYEWNGKIGGWLGWAFSMPELNDSDYIETKGFKTLKKACDKISIKISECVIETYDQDWRDCHIDIIENPGLEFTFIEEKFETEKTPTQLKQPQ